VQILVNNAGMPPGFFDGGQAIKPFLDTSPDEWEPVIRLNLYGVMYVSHAFVPGMVDAGWGRVITIVSDAGRTGDAMMAPYAASKAGAAGFMRSLATEVGKHGVTANCISLGTLWRNETAPTEEQLRKISRTYPVGRPGYPHDVAALIQFLASDASGWITGQVYPLNGGYSYAL
jgi:3-oxoacyl-[acyl-carrier protein] reductase